MRAILYGVGIATFCELLRYVFDMPSEVLPMSTAILAVVVAGLVFGTTSGVAALLTGAILSWYFILTNYAAANVFGFLAIGAASLVFIETNTRRENKLRNREAALATKQMDQQKLIARELTHRMKNTMTVIQAIAGQTLFGRGISADALATFNSRIESLGNAQSVIVEGIDSEVSLRKIICAAIIPFGEDNFKLDGPEITVTDGISLWLSLAVHELCTNALKYGALSTTGHVIIGWMVDDDLLRLIWLERGGPTVIPPTSHGFGTKLLGRAPMNVNLAYLPTGFECIMVQKLR